MDAGSGRLHKHAGPAGIGERILRVSSCPGQRRHDDVPGAFAILVVGGEVVRMGWSVSPGSSCCGIWLSSYTGRAAEARVKHQMMSNRSSGHVAGIAVGSVVGIAAAIRGM